MLKSSARYVFGLDFARFKAKNYDGTTATPARTVGGAGPFDFSSVSATKSAIPMTIKLDNAAASTKSINLTAAVNIAAVTVDELVTAIGTAAFTGITASKEAGTGYLLIKQTTVTAAYMQVYGTCAELALIGQGRGTKFIKSNTLKDFSETQTEKASETITTTDANGQDTEMVSDSYVKGGTGKFTDTAFDMELLAMIEGGTYDATAGKYSAPKPDSKKIYWDCEKFEKVFSAGSNKQGDMVGYRRTWLETCSGSSPESNSARGWADTGYTFIATEGKDETGAKLSWRVREMLSVAQFTALALESV